MAKEGKESPSNLQIELVIDTPIVTNLQAHDHGITIASKRLISPTIAKFHAGYFRISLSLCSQALLWRTPSTATADSRSLRRFLCTLPSAAFILLWSLAFFVLLSLSALYVLRCFLHAKKVKNEFLHHVGVNYMFAPWISWLLLLQSSPFFDSNSIYYLVLWWIFVVPILALDVKIYGQWFTEGKKFLSTVANPTNQLSVIGNLIGAWAAARMGCKEYAICMFSLGMTHYVVLFVTLYQRLSGNNSVPVMLRPVFFLFIAAPSMASLAWSAISGAFDNSSKMLFFLSLFLFTSLISRPSMFKKSMKKFNVAWWAYSYPLTILAIASTEYAQEVKTIVAQGLMIILVALSVVVFVSLMVFNALNMRCRHDTVLTSTETTDASSTMASTSSSVGSNVQLVSC